MDASTTSSHPPSLVSIHSYLQKHSGLTNGSSFIYINKKLSWRPSGEILQTIVKYFPSNTPLAFATSSPLLRIHTERTARDGFAIDGFSIAPKSRLELRSDQGDVRGRVVEEDKPRESLQYDFLLPSVLDADTQSLSKHRYPSAGFVPGQCPVQPCDETDTAGTAFCSQHCYRPNHAELSLCVAVTCSSPSALHMALKSAWWLSRYYGISLTLEGMKADQLQYFKELGKSIAVRELSFSRCVFSEDWLHMISACPELTSLSVSMCCAIDNVSLQHINPILSRPSSAAGGHSSNNSTTRGGSSARPSSVATLAVAALTNSTANGGAAAADRGAPRSSWYLPSRQAIASMKKLRCLHVHKTPVTPEFLNCVVSLCPALSCVILSKVQGIKSLQSLSSLLSLRSLAVQTLWLQEDGFDSLSLCRCLSHLCIEDCHTMSNLDFVRAYLPQTLQRLVLSNNWLIDSQLSRLGECRQLEELHLASLKRLTNLRWVEHLEKLSVLNVNHNTLDAHGCALLRHCSRLRILNLAGCRGLSTVRSWLPKLEYNLTSLDLSDTGVSDDSLEDSLVLCNSLLYLNLSGCTNITSLPWLTAQNSLRWLGLDGTIITNEGLNSLSTYTRLRYLSLMDCTAVTGLSFLSALSALEFLNLENTSVNDAALTSVLGCVFLSWLNLSRCRFVRDVAALSELPRLRELNLSECAITNDSLRNLSELRTLEVINVRKCQRLSALEMLTTMPSLKVLKADLLSLTQFPNSATAVVVSSPVAVHQGGRRPMKPASSSLSPHVGRTERYRRGRPQPHTTSAIDTPTAGGGAAVTVDDDAPSNGNPPDPVAASHAEALASDRGSSSPRSTTATTASAAVSGTTNSTRTVNGSAAGGGSGGGSAVRRRHLSNSVSAPPGWEARQRCWTSQTSGSDVDGASADTAAPPHVAGKCKSLGSSVTAPHPPDFSTTTEDEDTEEALDGIGASSSSPTRQQQQQRAILRPLRGFSLLEYRAEIAQQRLVDAKSDDEVEVPAATRRRGSRRDGGARSAEAPSSAVGAASPAQANTTRTTSTSTAEPPPQLTPHALVSAAATRQQESPDSREASVPATNHTSILHLSIRKSTIGNLELANLLRSCRYLTLLDLTDCVALSSLQALGHLNYLVELHASGDALTNDSVGAVAHCKALEHLTFSGSALVTDINAFSALSKLKYGDFSRLGVKNGGIRGLGACIGLKELHLTECRFLTSLNCLSTLTLLKELHVEGTEITFKGIRSLSRCTSLEKLYFNKCRKLTSVEHLRYSLPQLEIMELYGTSVFTRVAGQRCENSGSCSVM